MGDPTGPIDVVDAPPAGDGGIVLSGAFLGAAEALGDDARANLATILGGLRESLSACTPALLHAGGELVLRVSRDRAAIELTSNGVVYGSAILPNPSRSPASATAGD
jgi:hypothetical protein